MFGGNNGNSQLPISLGENRFPGEVNPLPQLQLFRDPVGCIEGPINDMGNEHTSIIERPPKGRREEESFSRQQKHQISSNNNFHQYEDGQLGKFLDPNLVSIGLNVSCEEEECNPSVKFASDQKTAALPIMLSLGDSVKAEIDRQKEEFDHHIRLQEENMIKEMREVGHRHTISLLSAIETGIGRKLLEKELQIQNMNRKNNELAERVKQISTEVHSWQCRAKYNESLVNALKSNLKQVMAQCISHCKEGCGDSEVDNAAFNANQNHKSIMGGNSISFERQITCRACKSKEASILLLPCRHLCLCKDCAGFVDTCLICQTRKTAGVEVFMS
ncbi:hypothetical protein P3X46_030974 [Hevea brasiliensis]|uniref:RING-type domain-containing protein n=1 Tax=Hevea brasiliensis TaxID=3981 RepID=A0ABQ9KIU5_HEVBR|nr:E3 ubiquitin-protein ligase BOI isoform X3 [Hevea brasiliensis]KAJ9140313.1 hypothetical protein P3X46_030974 [Hevea brasiliensis]